MHALVILVSLISAQAFAQCQIAITTKNGDGERWEFNLLSDRSLEVNAYGGRLNDRWNTSLVLSDGDYSFALDKAEFSLSADYLVPGAEGQQKRLEIGIAGDDIRPVEDFNLPSCKKGCDSTDPFSRRMCENYCEHSAAERKIQQERYLWADAAVATRGGVRPFLAWVEKACY